MLGVVVQRSFEQYLLDINSEGGHAALKSLEFQGATKTNKPNYPEGTLILCRVLKADKHSPRVELTCIDPRDKKAWNSGEATFRSLQGGLVKDFPVAFCRQLLSHVPTPGVALLECIGTQFPFEANIGFNGRVWIKAEKPAQVILVFTALERLVELGAGDSENVEFIARTLVN